MSKKEKAVVQAEQADGIQSVKEPETIDIAEISKVVGRYIILWRNDSKQIAKILEVLDDEMSYELQTGPDKGKKFKAKFFAKTIKIFDDENLILATTE